MYIHTKHRLTLLEKFHWSSEVVKIKLPGFGTSETPLLEEKLESEIGRNFFLHWSLF